MKIAVWLLYGWADLYVFIALKTLNQWPILVALPFAVAAGILDARVQVEPHQVAKWRAALRSWQPSGHEDL